MHIVECHGIPFLERKNAGVTDWGLSAWTEQAYEACHHDFAEESARTPVSPEHSEYGQKKFEAVVR